MPAERLPMRKVREVLRQRYACGASERVIAQSLGIGRTAVDTRDERRGLLRERDLRKSEREREDGGNESAIQKSIHGIRSARKEGKKALELTLARVG